MRIEPRQWIAIGAVWALLGVALGAFGAHALKETLEAGDQLENWRTGVRYQVWHALALILFGLYRLHQPGKDRLARVMLAGSILFSGSIYLLALDIGTEGVWPFTPLGGVMMMAAWLMFALDAWRGAKAG